jgi:NAD(P)-dependent dehydrogenase (short-subunit alcohol dehydrogenase family)
VELDELGVRVVEGVDIATDGGRAALVSALLDDTIDILINNAGIWCDDALGDLDSESLQHTFTVNAAAPLVLTDLLLPRMGQGSKIGLITSRMGSIEDNGSGSRYGYRMSKAALNAAGKSLAIDLRPRGIAVAILHPGFVRTRMVGFAGYIDPD